MRYLYATFGEYGHINPCSIRDTEEEGRACFEKAITDFHVKCGDDRNDGGLCLGKFNANEWRTIAQTGTYHQGVEYIGGWRAKLGGQ